MTAAEYLLNYKPGTILNHTLSIKYSIIYQNKYQEICIS